MLWPDGCVCVGVRVCLAYKATIGLNRRRCCTNCRGKRDIWHSTDRQTDKSHRELDEYQIVKRLKWAKWPKRGNWQYGHVCWLS